MKTEFEAGINIAIKIPKSKYDKTVAFYRDILKFDVQEKPIENPTVSRTHQVKFGNNVVWLDCVDNYTHSETWLELKTPDVARATEYLKNNGIETCDELEKIPDYSIVNIDGGHSVYIDYDVIEVINEFKAKAHHKHIELHLQGIPEVETIGAH